MRNAVSEKRPQAVKNVPSTLLDALRQIANGAHPTETIQGMREDGSIGPIPRYMTAAELQHIARAALAKAGAA